MLAWKIALRYLFSKKSHGAVNIISLISVIGVAVATMAITIVLSVFNGFTGIAADHLSLLDPEIKVTPQSGKTIASADSLATVLSGLPYISEAVAVIEERGLVIASNQQMPVHFKGIPADYNDFLPVDSVMVEGGYTDNYAGVDAAQISSGVAMKTGARAEYNNTLSLFVPRRMGRINPANPAAAFRGHDFMVTGIFQIGQTEHDLDHVYIPIDCARDLLQYTDEATAVELSVAHGHDTDKAVVALRQELGPDYRVQTRFEQEEDAFRMIQIEKWVTFLMLAFILVIASFNIISTLSLLVIEKRSNMETLRALGATQGLIRRIFIVQGWLISLVGGLVGIILGTVLSLCQQHFGWIKLSGDPSMLTITTYPVHVEATDLLIVFVLVMIVGLLTSQVTRAFTIHNS